MQKVLCLKSDSSSIIEGCIIEGEFYFIRAAHVNGSVEVYSIESNNKIEWYQGTYPISNFIDLAEYRDKQIDEILL